MPSLTPLVPQSAGAHSIVWQQRLRAATARRRVGDGETEALYAGLIEHGKVRRPGPAPVCAVRELERGAQDLAAIRDTALREKSLTEVVELYYRSGAAPRLNEKLKRERDDGAVPSPAPRARRGKSTPPA